MIVSEVFSFAGTHMLIYLAPMLLVFGGIAFADQIIEYLFKTVKRASKSYR